MLFRGDEVVILFSGRKNRCEKEIIQILTRHGANYISDKAVFADGQNFLLVSEYKKTDLHIKQGVAVLIDDTDRFDGQRFPDGMIGICEDSNKKGLEIFSKSGTRVISCGMGAKNTVTLSSLGSDNLLASLQRSLTDCDGRRLDPQEFNIRLTGDYYPFAVMACTAILLWGGITPHTF